MVSVNELFTGIGAFRKALINLGVEHEVVGISEIDKYAIKSYEAMVGRDPSDPTSRRRMGQGIAVQRLEARLDGLTNTLSTVTKDNLLCVPCESPPSNAQPIELYIRPRERRFK